MPLPPPPHRPRGTCGPGAGAGGKEACAGTRPRAAAEAGGAVTSRVPGWAWGAAGQRPAAGGGRNEPLGAALRQRAPGAAWTLLGSQQSGLSSGEHRAGQAGPLCGGRCGRTCRRGPRRCRVSGPGRPGQGRKREEERGGAWGGTRSRHHGCHMPLWGGRRFSPGAEPPERLVTKIPL